MDEQQMAQFMAMSPEEKQAYFVSQNNQQPPQQPPPQAAPQVDPRMGQPGQNQAMTPQQKMDGGDPRMFDDYAGKGAIIDDQQAKAEALRGTPSAQGMQTQNAGFVAANPLGHLASGLQQGMGNYQAKQALQAKKDLSDTVGTVQQGAAKKVMDEVQAEKQRALAERMRKNRAGTGSEVAIETNPRMTS
jgi:hypothetical protein